MSPFRHAGFTLIELLVFIVVSSLLMSVMLIGANTALRGSPTIRNQWLGLRLGQQCMDWYYRKREIEGFDTLACADSRVCGAAPGYTVTATFSCTTWNSDTGYKTITVNVAGLTNITLTGQIGDF